MKFIKNISISILYSIVTFLCLTLIITIFSYFNIIKDSSISTFKIIVILISVLIGGLIIGKKTQKKGWLEGLKLSLIIIFLLLFMKLLIFRNPFYINNLIYYIIIIITTMLGSMIGISKKKS